MTVGRNGTTSAHNTGTVTTVQTTVARLDGLKALDLRGVWNLVGMCVLYVARSVGHVTYAFYLPLYYQEDLGQTPLFAFFAMSWENILGLAFSFWIGILSNSSYLPYPLVVLVGRRYVFIWIGITMTAVGIGLFPVGKNFGWTIFCTLIFAMGRVVRASPMVALLSDLFIPSVRGPVNALGTVVVGIVAATVFILGASLLLIGAPLVTVTALVGVLTMLSLVISAFIVREPLPPHLRVVSTGILDDQKCYIRWKKRTKRSGALYYHEQEGSWKATVNHERTDISERRDQPRLKHVLCLFVKGALVEPVLGIGNPKKPKSLILTDEAKAAGWSMGGKDSRFDPEQRVLGIWDGKIDVEQALEMTSVPASGIECGGNVNEKLEDSAEIAAPEPAFDMKQAKKQKRRDFRALGAAASLGITTTGYLAFEASVSSFAVISLGFSKGLASYLTLPLGVFFILSLLPWSLAARVIGKELVLIIGFALLIVVCVVSFFVVHDEITYAVSMAFSGATAGSLVACYMPIILEGAKKGPGGKMAGAIGGVYMVSLYVAGILGPITIGLLVEVTDSFRSVFLLNAGCLMLGWAVMDITRVLGFSMILLFPKLVLPNRVTQPS